MCWNWEASLASGLIAISVGLILWFRNVDRPYDRWVAILATAIGSMQFIELAMWLDQPCTGVNQAASITGFILLTYIHPWLSCALAYYYWFRKSDNEKWKVFFLFWCLLTIAWSITRTAIYPPSAGVDCTRPSGEHLTWNWDRHLLPEGSVITLYYIFTFFPLLAQGVGRGLTWLAWSAIVAVIAMETTNNGASMYCFIGAFSGVLQIAYIPWAIQKATTATTRYLFTRKPNPFSEQTDLLLEPVFLL